MPAFGVTTANHYDVLGLDSSASAEEIKKAYRKLVRETHPDLVQGDEEKAAATIKFRQVQEAFECLSDLAKKMVYDRQSGFSDNFFGAHSWGETFTPGGYTHDYMYDNDPPKVSIPEPEDVIIDGVKVRIKYRQSKYNMRILADLYVDYHEVTHLQTFDPPTKADEIEKIVVTLFDEEIFSIWQYIISFDGLQESLRRYEQKAKAATEQKGYAVQLSQLKAQEKVLTQAGRPTAKLKQYVRDMGIMLETERYQRKHSIFHTPKSTTEWIKAIRTIENEINRIKKGGTTLLIDGLMDGSIYHRDVEANRVTLDEIDIFTIRTGNEFDTAFDDARLRDFYTDRVGDVSSTRGLAGLNLLISHDDFIIGESELDDLLVAPLTVELPSNKGIVKYSVAYSYREVKGEKVAVATIRMPRKVYDRVGYEYGKSGLPELPYGIRWYVEVTLEEQVIARGWDDKSLRNHVERHRKAQQRGGKLSNFEQNLYDATPLPPWARGKSSRSRRR